MKKILSKKCLGGQSLENKGFTLIELLAVIVILAIIASISVPIILNIIEDAKESVNKRSIDMYGKAIKVALANYELEEAYEGKFSIEKLEPYIEYSGNKVECNVYISSLDEVYLENCMVEGKEVEYTYGKEPIIRRATKKTKTIAGNIPSGNFDLGDEYIINVDGIHKYHFYALSTEGDKVNLIMSNNICRDGTLASTKNICGTPWISKADYNGEDYETAANSKGPITVMNRLYEATKNWRNIENIQINYTDEGNTGRYGYGKITTTGSTTIITKKDRTETAKYENLKARLITNAEVTGTGCSGSYGSCPAWMVNGLSASTYYPEGTKDDVEEILGYWSLSSYVAHLGAASYVHYDGKIEVASNSKGIRPVIEVLKSDF